MYGRYIDKKVLAKNSHRMIGEFSISIPPPTPSAAAVVTASSALLFLRRRIAGGNSRL